jgi:hypothetical protein
LERAYRGAYNGAFPAVPYPSEDAARRHRPAHAQGGDGRSEKFVDMSLLQELEASGFIKQLYKR